MASLQMAYRVGVQLVTPTLSSQQCVSSIEGDWAKPPPSRFRLTTKTPPQDLQNHDICSNP